MRFSIISVISVISTLVVFVAAGARLESFYAPATINSGEGANLKFGVFPYISSVRHVSIACGWKPQPAQTDSLGPRIGEWYLGDEGNQVGNVTKWVGPFSASTGPATIICSVHSLYGVDSVPVLDRYAANVLLGSVTSNQYVQGTKLN